MASSQYELISVGNYSIRKGEKIGKGQWGSIFSGEIVQSKKKIAIKQLLELTKQEEIILQKLKGKKFDHIVEVLTYEQKQDGNIYILMEIGKEVNIKEVENKEETFLQMVKGVQQFHKLGFFHRDLKPENFVICEDGWIKLIDFGITKEIKEIIQTKQIDTFHYLAPEVLAFDNYDQFVDLWSLGIIFFEILTRKNFFEDSNTYLEILLKRIEITQLQINTKIKEHNLKNWQVKILEKMIVQRLDKNREINTNIKRIGIDALVEELEKYCPFKWQEQAEDVQISIWNNSSKCFTRGKFQIQYTKDSEIIYSQNGMVIRKDQIVNILVKPEVLKNLEQIKYLQWIGNYDQNKKKVGRWEITWNGENLNNVGGEYLDGRKTGQWKDLTQNYWSQAQVYEIGKYENNIRKGVWEFVYNNYKIGGGQFNNDGNKQGKWIDLFENFFYNAQVTYNGEYNMNNMKVGRWDIMYDKVRDRQYKQIGGGQYDKEGNQKKIGKWVELFEGFQLNAQVTYNGEYNINSMKVGRWDIMYCQIGKQEYQQMQILFVQKTQTYSGGGSYDQEGNQKKIGKWVELFEGFQQLAKVTYDGEYNMNNMKVGKWDIMFEGDWMQILQNLQEYLNIYIYSGGGQYDKEGNQNKIGNWVELFEGFHWKAQVIYNGEYNMNNMKVGRWDIMYCKNATAEYKQMQILQNLQEYLNIYNYSGGGQYDKEGNQKKIGKWVELFEGFQYDAQVTYNGEYNMNNMKVGRWDIMYCKWDEKEFKQMQILFIYKNIQYSSSGGGKYDQEGNQKKIGSWVELDEEFGKWEEQIKGPQYCNQVTHNGEYNMKGQKVGIWVEMDIKHNYKRGEKKYDI
ncbi:unnamed protein product [Paramecium sonneborni]|uniref:Protein kinase domain-containing protein n=1 Tax=Paramecium sonneborni TaxID=65129 RepID=A0A8S1PP43_9CILI|nr:unnamed protein product [Paramecium sonneborni]